MRKTVTLAILANLFCLPVRDAVALGPVLTRSIATQSHCHLFPDGIQDVVHPTGLRLESFEPTRQYCQDVDGLGLFATRQMLIKGERYLLVVDPKSLETSVVRASCYSCEPSSEGLLGAAMSKTRFLQSLERLTAAPFPLQNDGLTGAEQPVKGSFVTGDLCPSHKALDRVFFDEIFRLEPGAPIALAISGKWIENHGADFAWIKERVARGDFRVTWVNHSYTHPFKEGIENADNFLLRPGLNLRREILEAERVMIAGGITPSVFFRAPGLISNERLIAELKKLDLLPLGAEAWLAKGEKAKDGSIILVHVNGNEPFGLKLLLKLITTSTLPTPLLPLITAPAP